MRHLIRLSLKVLIVSLWCGLSYGGSTVNPHTGELQMMATVTEEDGSPSSNAPTTIKVPNGSLTDNGDGSVSISAVVAEADTLDTVSDRGATTDKTLTAGGFSTAGNITATGYVSCDQFTDAAHYTGFPDRTSTSLSWDDGSYTLTLTATADPVWINGVSYTINTVTKALSVAQEAVSGLYWFWATQVGGVVSLNASTTHPGFDKCLVATVYWNTTTNKGILSDERHWFGRDRWWHEYTHETIGARYASGLAGTFTDTTFEIGIGEFYDEDIEHSITPAKTVATVLYHNGDSDWAWDTTQTTPYKVVGGGDNNLRYNSGTALATVGNNKYVNYWVFISGDSTEPVHIVIGTNQYATIALARAASVPSLGALPSAEEKLIYKITYQNNGGTPDYIEATDYRSSSNIPVANYVAMDHGSLSGLSDDDHSIYLLANGTRNLTGTQVVNGSLIVRDTLGCDGTISGGTLTGNLLRTSAYIFPTFDSSAGYCLKTNGSGVLYFDVDNTGSGGASGLDGLTGYSTDKILQVGGLGAPTGTLSGDTVSGNTVIGSNGMSAPTLYGKGLSIEASVGSPLIFKTSGAEAMRITTDYRVGIGMVGDPLAYTRFEVVTGDAQGVQFYKDGVAGLLFNYNGDGGIQARDSTLGNTQPLQLQPYGANVWIPRDSAYMAWGAGADCGIMYDGTNMIIDPDLVGTGYVTVSGILSAPTLTGNTIECINRKSRSFVVKSIAATDDFIFWKTPKTIVIKQIAAKCDSGTNVVGQILEYNSTGTVGDGTGYDMTITTTEVVTGSTLTNNTIDAGDWIGWKTTSVSGTVNNFSLSFDYYEAN